MSSPLVRANYLSPVDPKVAGMVSQLSRDEKLKMLNGGERLNPEWWTIDFDATAAAEGRLERHADARQSAACIR